MANSSFGTRIAFYCKKAAMKNMVLGAALTGAAVAGLIIYFQNRNDTRGQRRVKDAAQNAYDTMNANIGHVERGAQKILS